MEFDAYDWNSIILGLLATCLFAECIILLVRVNSLKNSSLAEAEKIRTDEKLKYEKKGNELEMLYKEREIELKSEYEDLLSMAKAAKREQDEKLAELDARIRDAKFASERAEAEYARFSAVREDFRNSARQYAEKLAGLANLDVERMREEAKREVRKKCMEDLSLYKSEILEKSKREIDAEARRILVDSMQRMVPQLPQSATVSMVKIPDEAMKGRIIGKEGRNIRVFESETGTTLVIDETPEYVFVSSFNPTRREIAKTALEALVSDGRINPSTIEQAVAAARGDIEGKTFSYGAEAVESLGLARVNPEIVSLLGRLNFHSSLNQNTLEHSVETARIAGMIAAEINCDPSTAKRAGLFHDIGKAVSDQNLSHARAGAAALLKCGESGTVANAVEAHHSEVEARSIYALIVQAADALSATRRGARMEAMEGYIKRVRSLEGIALSFEGVSNAYVIQAGRELRVMVSPDAVGDIEAREIARKIREKVEQSVDSAFPVKVTLVRERRYVEFSGERRG